jgi:flavodoxin
MEVVKMKSIVIYASRYGNTQRIAEAITETLQTHGEAQLFPADEALPILPKGIDLVVIGGPTETHRMTKPVARLFARMGRGVLQGMAGAAFDTRLRGSRMLTGSAGSGVARKLRRAGARLIVPAESFFVKNQADPEGAELEPGELERAATWAESLATLLTVAEEVTPPATQS